MLKHQWPALLLSCIVALTLVGAIRTARADDVPIPESHIYHLSDSLIAQSIRCTECHTDDTGVALKPIGIFNHSSSFLRRHRFYAVQTDTLCRACHLSSFCTDCHATRAELKPSAKHAEAPERWMPHRGDYLFQHRIDGRIDPTTCFRCHGRQNNELCKQCHRP
jgi:hypothetical protein